MMPAPIQRSSSPSKASPQTRKKQCLKTQLSNFRRRECKEKRPCPRSKPKTFVRTAKKFFWPSMATDNLTVPLRLPFLDRNARTPENALRTGTADPRCQNVTPKNHNPTGTVVFLSEQVPCGSPPHFPPHIPPHTPPHIPPHIPPHTPPLQYTSASRSRMFHILPCSTYTFVTYTFASHTYGLAPESTA